MVTIKFNIASR